MQIDPTKIMLAEEIQEVLDDLDKRAASTTRDQTNRIIFVLSCCCGLRRKEIAGLRVEDILMLGRRPGIRIRPENTKGANGRRRRRFVPPWWDTGTRETVEAWTKSRKRQGALTVEPLVCGTSKSNVGKPLELSLLPKRWRTAIRVLGPERVKQLSIHAGRHSFISHALSCGRSLPEVRDAVGHSSVAVINCYLHAIESNSPDLFPRNEGGRE